MYRVAKTTNLLKEISKPKYLHENLPINMFMGQIDEGTTSLKSQLLVYLIVFRILPDGPLGMFVMLIDMGRAIFSFLRKLFIHFIYQ